MHPAKREDARLGPLDFNIKYGPHAISHVGARAFMVPIQPQFHHSCFRNSSGNSLSGTESHSFGNSIRKAYLCHSQIRKIAAGDAIFFYRSQDDQAVTAVGVAVADAGERRRG